MLCEVVVSICESAIATKSCRDFLCPKAITVYSNNRIPPKYPAMPFQSCTAIRATRDCSINRGYDVNLFKDELLGYEAKGKR